MPAKTKDRRQINQERIASYSDDLFCYRQGKDGIVRFATELDFENTLKGEGFTPYDPSDDDLREWGPLPYFARRKGRK